MSHYGGCEGMLLTDVVQYEDQQSQELDAILQVMRKRSNIYAK